MSASLPVTLESREVPYPVLYLHAKTALAECAKIDEVKDWADKAAALKAYAAQRDDEELLTAAKKIQLRANRRMGQLLKEIEPGKPGPQPELRAGGGPYLNRTEAAAEAGLSPRKAKQAMQVASVPEDEFEEMAESGATIKEVAERGKDKKKQAEQPKVPSDSIWVYGTLCDMEQLGYFDTEPQALLSAMWPVMQQDTIRLIPKLKDWVIRFEEYINVHCK